MCHHTHLQYGQALLHEKSVLKCSEETWPTKEILNLFNNAQTERERFWATELQCCLQGFNCASSQVQRWVQLQVTAAASVQLQGGELVSAHFSVDIKILLSCPNCWSSSFLLSDVESSLCALICHCTHWTCHGVVCNCLPYSLVLTCSCIHFHYHPTEVWSRLFLQPLSSFHWYMYLTPS